MGIQKKFSLYAIFSILSLDVVVGAVIGAAFVSRILGVHPDGWYYLILALSVWILYTADHLVDAWRLKENAHTDRHLFHFRNFNLLVFLIMGLASIDLIIIWLKLPSKIIIVGVFLLFISGAYLGFLSFLKSKRSIFLQKELIIAIVYTSGVWAGPVALRNFILQNHEIILLIVFFLIVLADVLLYSIMEEKEDRLDNHHTFATNFGMKQSQRVLSLLLFLSISICIFLILMSGVNIHLLAAKLFLLMAFVIIILFSFPDFFKQNYSYRYIGELIFWLPVFLLF